MAKPAPKPSTVTLLDRQVDALDRLVGDMRLGVPSQRAFDEFEARGQAIAAGIIAALRGGGTSRA